MSIARYKKNVDRITDNMITFSLNPTIESFNEICACNSLVREAGEFFHLFVSACMLCYSTEWKLNPDDTLQPVMSGCSGTIGQLMDNITQTVTDLKLRAISQPTFTTAVKLLYIFYATGEQSMIELFYQCMGHELMNKQTKEQLIPLYRNTREKYQKKTADLLKLNAEYFSNHHVDINIADFSYFDKLNLSK